MNLSRQYQHGYTFSLPEKIGILSNAEKLSPEALAECLKQLPQESLEGLAASDQRLITQGRSSAITEFK